MTRIRLLPIVIVAVSGLLVLKATELATSADSLFSSSPKKTIRTEDDLPRFARVLARMRFIPPPDPEITGSLPAKADAKKSDAKPSDTKPSDPKKTEPAKPAAPKAEDKAQTADAKPPTPDLPPDQQPLPVSLSPSERAIIERLQERRGAIEDRQKEIDLKENLLRAAEKQVDGRIHELKEIEGRLTDGQKNEKQEAERQMRMLVVMYETMKPKDAARVFDRLSINVMVPIATAMKPARMAEILAVMTPEAAEKLTVALATRSAGIQPELNARDPSGKALQPGELPRVDQKRR
jgi:flagellar motility protein MotE (MotC chaperone)